MSSNLQHIEGQTLIKSLREWEVSGTIIFFNGGEPNLVRKPEMAKVVKQFGNKCENEVNYCKMLKTKILCVLPIIDG